MKYLHLIFTFFVFTAGSLVNAQHISGAMQFENPIEEKDSGSISFSISNLFYFRDYEYFNNIQTGYTTFGTWQYPRITYQPNKWLRMDAGVLLQKEFGDKNFDKALPVFSLQIQRKDLRFLFGALESNQAHQLIEPLMQYDQVIERPIEEGFQFKVNKKRFKSDVWLDWEVHQKINANYPEELTGGLSTLFTLTAAGKPLQIKIPLQLLIPHKGGQLDTNSSIVSTVINHAEGLWIESNNPEDKDWLRQIRTDGYYTGYRHSENDNPYPYENGQGFLWNFFLRSKWDVFFLATFWKGHQYIAPKGGKLFQSISSITTLPNYSEPDRKLFFLNLGYEKKIAPGFFIDFRYSPYRDLHNHLTEHAFLLMFSYRGNFRLRALKK